MTMDEKMLSRRIRQRYQELKTERSSWLETCRDVSDFINPRHGRYSVTDRNLANSRKNKILDSSALRSQRTLSAGLMSGMTSPARPWFNLQMADPDLNKVGDVKNWLFDVSEIMRRIFSKSNVYRMLHTVYDELSLFGTAPAVLNYHHTNIIHGFPLTAGEYCIGADEFGQIDTLYREYQMTCKAMVEQFGDKVSSHVMNLYNQGKYDVYFTVLQCIEPRLDSRVDSPFAKDMPFRSIYIDDQGNILRESGYKQFPVVAPRWSVCSNDTYGVSPAMDALPDVKQLQLEQLRKSQGIDQQNNPTRIIPASMKNKMSSLMAGGVLFAQSPTDVAGVRSAFDIKPDLNGLLMDIQDIRQRIDSTFYADLFRMFEGSTQQMTAYEVSERQQEKMLMLGPVLERLDNELLSPLIQRTFDFMLQSNKVPPAPEDVQGQEMMIEYTSVMAQAQKAVSINNQSRFLNSLGSIAQLDQNVLDKFDADAAVDDLADSLGVNPKMIISGRKLAAIRQQKAKAQAQAQAQQQGLMAAQQARDMSQIDQQNLNDVMGNLMGYGDTGAM